MYILTTSSGTANAVNVILKVITPFRNLILCTESRREMEEWMSAIRAAAANEFYDVSIQLVEGSPCS